jgi:pSer/pThr/pTyr-binding forkhead associated (FHA) protein
MAKPYTVPDWARHSPEALRYSLEVIKDGAVVDEIELLSQEDPQKPQIKSYYILGRQPDIVDILLEHPSLSRQHAILQFRDDDALMCLDFNSAQGTFVNKVQLEQGVYQRIYVGDILKFGQYTLFFVFKGP